MKGIFIIIDGMGDRPNKLLNEKTPLEAAQTPNLNFLATRGKLGWLYPVRPGFIPESDEAVVSIFDNNLLSSTRGQLEAKGAGLKLTRGDLAFRINFATIDNLKKGTIIDRRAGRTLTTEEAEILAKAINKMDFPVKFFLKPTIQHRGVLVFEGGFSDNISTNDLIYSGGKSFYEDKIHEIKPLDNDENSQYTANVVSEFLEKSFEILDKHQINIERKKKGLLPANYILLRGPGIEKPKLKQYRGWVSMAYMPLEKGIAELSGMKVFSFDYPKLTGLDSYECLWDGLKKACKFSIKFIKRNNKNANYAFIHIKETDIPGHDNKPIEKKNMIEYIDKTLFKFLRKFAPLNNIRVVVSADHSTPCSLKSHSSDPVPVLFYDNSIPKEKEFSEKEARKGVLGGMRGSELLKKTGFIR